MSLERVAELVRRAAEDAGVVRDLRVRPERLVAKLGLTDAQLAALRSASSFPLPLARSAAKRVAATAAAGSKDAALDQMAETTGSLLPPEGSGQFTGSTGGFRQPVPPSEPGPSPQTPAPATPQAPEPRPAPQMPAPGVIPQTPAPGQFPQPQGPVPGVWPTPIPMITPTGPTPTCREPIPRQPEPPCPQPGTPQGLTPTDLAQGCSCTCVAISGVVASVSLTATTALTALVALSANNRRN
jgi:hypothetical protein